MKSIFFLLVALLLAPLAALHAAGDLKANANPSAKLNPHPTPAAAPDQAAISSPGWAANAAMLPRPSRK